MAIAPQARLVLAKLLGSRSKPSIKEYHEWPTSSERKTPPFAVAAYRRFPPELMAILPTRPATAGRPTACPCATTAGPMGSQLLTPGMAGIPGTLTNPGAAVTLR